MKRGVEFYDVRGEVEIDFHVRPHGPEEDEPLSGTLLAQKLMNGTVVLSGAKVQSFTPPHPDYKQLGADVNRYRIRLLVDSFGIDDQPDLMAELEAALGGGPALIHGCHDFNSPETCYACSLLHRIRKIRQQTVSP